MSQQGKTSRQIETGKKMQTKEEEEEEEGKEKGLFGMDDWLDREHAVFELAI